jgi:transposase-like protein
MPELAQVGDFCPNPACTLYGKAQAGQANPNIIKFGRSRQGRQRYRCKACGQAFCERTGTLFHNRKTAESEIIECLALIAEGMRISSLSRVKGIKEDTILDWIRSAGAHAEAIEAVLLAEYELSRGQLDGLWSYVGNKGEKKTTQRQKTAANSGGRR